MSAHYLKAMEEVKFNSMLKVFDSGYSKICAKILEMDRKSILDLFAQKRYPYKEPLPD
jgi:cytoskeletal protein RodZ